MIRLYWAMAYDDDDDDADTLQVAHCGRVLPHECTHPVGEFPNKVMMIT